MLEILTQRWMLMKSDSKKKAKPKTLVKRTEKAPEPIEDTYSVSDIGKMYQLSGYKFRQFCKRAGIREPLKKITISNFDELYEKVYKKKPR